MLREGTVVDERPMPMLKERPVPAPLTLEEDEVVVVVVEDPPMMACPAGESWCTQPSSPHTWFAGAR